MECYNSDEVMFDQRYIIGVVTGVGLTTIPFFVYQCSKTSKWIQELIAGIRGTKHQEVKDYVDKYMTALPRYTETKSGKYKTLLELQYPRKNLYNKKEYDDLCILEKHREEVKKCMEILQKTEIPQIEKLKQHGSNNLKNNSNKNDLKPLPIHNSN